LRKWIALPLGGALLLFSLLLPVSASAHERRDVGNYEFVVGFLNEPAIADQMNGIDLTVTSKADGKPVEGLEKTLKVEVVVGGNAKSMPITLQTRFNMPGKYAGYFEPTAPGAYIFHFSGAINGDPVDQRFESGPGRFDDVEPLAPLQFPNKLADPASLQTQLADAQLAARTARVLAIAGIVVGAVGIAVGIAGFRRQNGKTTEATSRRAASQA
jgi:hypothetical protein